MIKKIHNCICVICVIIFVISFCLPVLSFKIYAEKSRFQAAYDFDGQDIKTDLGGRYSLPNPSIPWTTSNDRNGRTALKSYANLNPKVFEKNIEMSLGLWVKFTSYGGITQKEILYTGAYSVYKPYISLDFSYTQQAITITLTDGTNVAYATGSIASYLDNGAVDWMHIAFTYEKNEYSYVLKLYINGVLAGESASYAELSKLKANNAYITNFLTDDIYITNTALSDDKIYSLMTSSLADFLYAEDSTWTNPDPSAENPDPEVTDPFDPYDPYDPLNPLPGTTDPLNPYDKVVTPVNDFTWLAYTFDQTFDLTRDLNKKLESSINIAIVNSVNTKNYNGSFGRGLTRRKSAYPNAYLKLNDGLLYSQNSFTFAAWVYRELLTPAADPTQTDPTTGEPIQAPPSNVFEYYDEFGNPITTPQISADAVTNTLFEFNGKGKLVFSPFSTTTDGTANAFFEYGSNRDATIVKTFDKGKLTPTITGKWVHFAFSFDRSGQVTIYTNGVVSAVYETDLRLSDLKITDLKILSNTLRNEQGRILLDDIYMSSKALQASDIRKIKAYGAERYVSEVLPDPNPDKSNNPTLPSAEDDDVDLRPDDSDMTEDKYADSATINGYIGTTFDEGLIGKDYNNTVFAAIRNASLTQGINVYGLSLNGSNSYLRYPLGILDDAKELTISIAYNWNGHVSGSRTQKLFSLSSKNSSIDNPKSYLYLSMGDGSSGMEFSISDGSKTTTLKTDINSINKWQRVTVTIKSGIIKLYIDDAEIAQANTLIDISSIKPNFSYIGKSGTKGDPLFSGAVDEVYISKQAVSVSQIEQLKSGIVPVSSISDDTTEAPLEETIWEDIIKGVLVATGGLVALIVIVIIITIIKNR